MSEQIKGKISQIIGAVVDVQFSEGTTLPNIYDALEVIRPNGEKLILECEQDIGEDTMRSPSAPKIGIKKAIPDPGPLFRLKGKRSKPVSDADLTARS